MEGKKTKILVVSLVVLIFVLATVWYFLSFKGTIERVSALENANLAKKIMEENYTCEYFLNGISSRLDTTLDGKSNTWIYSYDINDGNDIGFVFIFFPLKALIM